MRFEIDLRGGGQVAEVTLSKRNLLALLTKLDMPGSKCTITSREAPAGWMLSVRSESDERHYDKRPFAPGRMHPITEEAIREG